MWIQITWTSYRTLSWRTCQRYHISVKKWENRSWQYINTSYSDLTEIWILFSLHQTVYAFQSAGTAYHKHIFLYVHICKSIKTKYDFRMKEKPAISILIPCSNWAMHISISLLIDSILKLTYSRQKIYRRNCSFIWCCYLFFRISSCDQFFLKEIKTWNKN